MAHVLDLRKEKLAEENGRLNDLEETIGSLRQQRQELIQLQTRLTTFINVCLVSFYFEPWLMSCLATSKSNRRARPTGRRVG